ncbi:MAG: beta-glucosidase, partial [Chloroflexi bacterium]|nr:beta-glucosidase [Chloroflexota bacterium]
MKTPVKPEIDRLLNQMTLEEKLAQLGSYWVYSLQTRGELDAHKIEDKLKHGIGQVTRVAGASTRQPRLAAAAANQLQKYLVEHTRLGIPAILHEECCSGSMILGGTMYPQMLGLASTFQTELAERMTVEIRRQLRAIGAHQGLAPVLDVARDARWGRVEETFGEDPLLASQFGISYVRGLQGDDLRQGVMATGKHFVGHSFSQGGLNCGPVHMGPRELWDIYLMPFQAAIQEAGLASIMNAYPELDGEVVAASRRILTGLLRDTLGFDGLVVSDYEAVDMIYSYHHAAANRAEAAAMALKAGIDVELPVIQCYGSDLKTAVESGLVGMDLVDESVSRHLRKKFELGLFENPYVDEGRVAEVFETPAQRRLAGEIARQSMVLLSNSGILPLANDGATLAVIGPNADQRRNLLGDYSYAALTDLMLHTQPADSAFVGLDPATLDPYQVQITTVLESIRAAAPQARVLYAQGCANSGDDVSGIPEAVQIAGQADVVILVLGDKTGLTPECTSGETRDSADLLLPGVQAQLFEAVLAAGKPVVVVLVNGRPLAIPALAEKADAILEAWIPGEEGGPAIADVLFGATNPGGKLPMTFPRSVGQLPIFYNNKPSGGHSHWYVDYVAESACPLFPFGHGLSYTSFEYSDLSVTVAQGAPEPAVAVGFTLKNSGPRAGDEVVQLYVCDQVASSPRPVKELKGFARLSLQPGEACTVTFKLPLAMLAYYD